MSHLYKTDIIIIGAGPIGLFTIFQAGMLGMRCHVIDSLEQIGGQCQALYPEKPIYDIPAYPTILASELIEKLAVQNSPFNPVYHLNQQVISLEKQDEDFIITTSKNIQIIAKVVVIAAGSGAFGPNRPPLANIEEYEDGSVFYNVQDKNIFQGGNLVIAGGGDSAIDWTLQLAKIANKIYLVHRRDKFRAAPASIQNLELEIKQGKVELVVPYQLYNINGSNGKIHSIGVQDFSGNIRVLEANKLLAFFGLNANLGPILNWGLNIDMHHINVEQPHYETNISGIYAIGDIATYEGKLKLILTGFAEAANCVHHAYNKVCNGKILHFKYSTTKGVNKLD